MFARHSREGWTTWGDEAGVEVEPRGKASRGYAGGAIERIPHVDPHVRLPEGVSNRIAEILREGYEDGESIDSLAKDSGLSIARVRGLLKRAGVEVRPQGRPTKK